jgi:hypothetical protein
MMMQVLPRTDIIRHGKTRQGKQRSCCQETVGDGRTFLLEYSYAGPVIPGEPIPTVRPSHDSANILSYQ